MTLLSDDGSTVIVTANHLYVRRARTYNLTVDDLHTYYVLAGDTPVLVHNSDSCLTPLGVQVKRSSTIGIRRGELRSAL